MAPDLKSPVNFRTTISALISLIISSFSGCSYQFIWKMMETEANLSEWIFSVVYGIYVTCIFSILYLPNLFCILWIEKFSRLCEEAKIHEIKRNSKICIEYYKQIEASLGLYFLYVFSICQFFILIFLFLIISVQTMEIFAYWERVLASVSCIFMVIYLAFIVLNLTATSEAALTKLKALVCPLQKQHMRGDSDIS